MALIKSSLEIALERAAALMADGGGADEAQLEGGKRGQALARNFLGGEISAPDLVSRLGALPTAQRGAARQGAFGQLTEALDQGDGRAVDGLVALASERGDAGLADEMARGGQALEAVAETVRVELAELMLAELAQAGVSGPALRPRAEAHPELDERLAQAGQKARRDLSRAVSRLESLLQAA